MPDLSRVTPLVLTYNEAPNIGRTLERLGWADRIVVVDSGSDDGTREIIESVANADLFVREFDRHERQWEYALEKATREWVLTLDADYLVPEELAREIAAIRAEPPLNGFYAPFRYRVLNRTLTRSLYPPRQVLFRKDEAAFESAGHTQRVRVNGRSGDLSTPIVHDDRKPFGRWLQNQVRYAPLEAERLGESSYSALDLADRLRKTRVLGAPGVFFYCLIGKLLLFEGWAGWYYTLERTLAEMILTLTLLRRDAGVAESDRGDSA